MKVCRPTPPTTQQPIHRHTPQHSPVLTGLVNIQPLRHPEQNTYTSVQVRVDNKNTTIDVCLWRMLVFMSVLVTVWGSVRIFVGYRPTDPHTFTTTDIKTNMRHIHTSIVSRDLASRGNNKILRTLPPHISTSEERLPRLTRRTLAQLRTNKSPFLKSYLHKVDAKSHPSPLCPICNTNIHNTHHLFNFNHIRTMLSLLDLWTALLARWTEKLVGGHKREDRTPLHQS